MDQLQFLKDVPPLIWAMLEQACSQTDHHWRIAALANVDTDTPLVRSLVLRDSMPTQARLRFYTDRRSRKWPAIKHQKVFSSLFYDTSQQLQLTMTGPTMDVTTEVGDQLWAELPVHSRAAYASELAPGTPLATGGNGLTADFFELPLAATAYARPHFAVFDLCVQQFEVLQLHRQGHRRARFHWHPDTQHWSGQWLVP